MTHKGPFQPLTFCDLLHSGGTPPRVQCPALEPPAQEGHGAVRAGPEEAAEMIRGLEHLSYEDSPSSLSLLSPEEKALGRPYSSLPVPGGGL